MCIEKILEALDASIEKWDNVVTNNLTYEDFKDTLCPLCKEFICDEIDDPDICPIYLDTGECDCYGTFFYDSSLYEDSIPENRRQADIKMQEYLHDLRRRILDGEAPMAYPDMDWCD